MLPIFGASLFSKAPSTFAPVDNIPVTPDYVIGPGDEIRLQIWGQINQHGSFVVDRTGSIALPQIGTIHVAGLQFSQLTDFLRSQLSRVYRNFDLNVNLGQLRSIQVFVVGQARQPGSYTISSLSTLLNALFASGGPLPQGSLRDIQVRRNGQSVTHFDLYDLLLRGDKSKDVRLEPGDVIFIPDVGPQVAVSGSVTTPAVYELRGKTSFAQVLQLAGGLTNTAANSRLRVERIDEHIQRSMVEVALDSAGTTEAHNGDIISVDSILGRFKDAVTLRGNVANPGRYQWHQGMRISDLIPNREMLVTRDYYRRLIALGRPEAQPQISPYNSGFYNPQGPYSTQGPYPAGAGGYPSDTSGYPGAEGSYTSDQSGSSYPNGRQGYSADRQGYPSNDEGGLGIRQNYSPTYPGGQSGQQRTGSSASGGGTSVGAALTDTNANFAPKNDVVLAAPDIDWQYAVIERQSASDLTTSLLPFNLAKAVLDHDTTQDLELLPGDIITIFSKADIRVPSAQQTKFVKLEGEFVAAGVYSVKPGETLRQLVIRAGGLTSDADLFASEFTRDSVRRLQKQRLLEFADALQSQISANSTANTASALTERDAAAVASSASEARTVVARLRSTEPNGRIVLPLKPDASGVGALPDIPLQDNDRFIVPRIPSTVTVEGQVYNPNAFLYLKGRRVKDYLRLAGGPDRVGDRSREFVLRADGSVVSRQYGTFAQHALFSNRDFDDVVLYPGDTIVVPPIIQKSAVLRNLSDISTILEGFGLGAAAIQVLR
ncbi:MAG TPA: SLBB domain-containing protein [Acidobacteriaceae bacterium]|nr:SLBB domain-containing protein [Acidobacteriaceae bacterium]